MKSRPWYKRYPTNFIAGTMSLSLEEAGAYSYIIDLIFDRGGKIPDDSQWLGRVCGCSTRKITTLKIRLVEEGKISISNGFISNKKADYLMAEFEQNENKSEIKPIYPIDNLILIDRESNGNNDITPLDERGKKKDKKTITKKIHWTEESLLQKSDVDWAVGLGYENTRLEKIYDGFRQHWIDKGEQNAAKSKKTQRGWSMAWKNWLKHDIDWNGQPNQERNKNHIAG